MSSNAKVNRQKMQSISARVEFTTVRLVADATVVELLVMLYLDFVHLAIGPFYQPFSHALGFIDFCGKRRPRICLCHVHIRLDRLNHGIGEIVSGGVLKVLPRK